MARQIPTQADLDQANADLERFALPFSASLQLNDRTVYGTTDPEIALSMVNVGHLNDTRMFRGTWESTPTDRGQGTAYRNGQVVIGSDNHLYRLIDGQDGTQNPVGNNGVDWMILSSVEAPVTELYSMPESIQQNLFTPVSTTFTVAPTANATLVNPTTSVSATGNMVGTPTAPITAAGSVTVTAVPQIDANAAITVTTEAESTDGTQEFTAGQVDTIVSFVDGRQVPTVLPEEDQRVSILGTTTNPSWEVDTTPGTATVAAGTAFDSNVRVAVGTGGSTPLVGTTFTAPALTANTMITFSFPLVSSPTNGQTGAPADITRGVNVYTPWFYSFSPTAPTAVGQMQEGILVGETQGNNFPSNNTSQFTVTEPTAVNSIRDFWIATPASRNIANLQMTIGFAVISSVVDGQITANSIQYNLHRFRLGLVASPSTFTLITS